MPIINLADRRKPTAPDTAAALDALEAYAGHRGKIIGSGMPMHEAVRGLIRDLGHLCDANGIDFMVSVLIGLDAHKKGTAKL